ncbi:GcvH Glycine cleavage system H protein (lipoate-binding) [Fimbriimonadaceae bacterium]
MSNVPGDLKYVESHEWVKVEGDVVTIGVTDFAQSELGDVVFVELPEVGRILQVGDVFGQVESVKSVSDLYAPVAGEVIEANPALAVDTALVNSDPYGSGFMLKVRLSNPADVDALMDAARYQAIVG